MKKRKESGASKTEEEKQELDRRIAEAIKTGNPIENIGDRWVDYERIGARDENDLDRIIGKVGGRSDIVVEVLDIVVFIIEDVVLVVVVGS